MPYSSVIESARHHVSTGHADAPSRTPGFLDVLARAIQDPFVPPDQQSDLMELERQMRELPRPSEAPAPPGSSATEL